MEFVYCEVQTESLNIITMSMHVPQNARQNGNKKITNKPTENAAKFIYLKTTLKSSTYIYKIINIPLHSGNTCYLLVQNFWSSKNIRFDIQKTIPLPLVYMGCTTWSLILRE